MLEISLKPHQKKAIKFLNDDRNNGLILVHPTGYGKTLTAAVYSQNFLEKYPEQKVVFVAPASLLDNFKKELKKIGIENYNSYKFYSYQTFLNKDPQDCPNDLLIVDEAHNMRTLALKNQSQGKMSKKVFACAARAKKRLLLTATPFINDIMDFDFLINAVYGRLVLTSKRQLSSAYDLKLYLRNKVDYINLNKENSALFPSAQEHYERIKMEPSYEEKYCKVIRGRNIEGTVFTKPYSFYNAHRQAVNKIGNQTEYLGMKMNRTIQIIGKSKSVIYTNWLKYGVQPISKALKEKQIKFKIFSGNINAKEKTKIITEYNQDQFQVLIITSAGREGLDLKGVRKLIVMDPVWNFAGIEQIKGRVIRMGSHLHLPPSERKVDIYYMMLVTSDDLTRAKSPSLCHSGDTLVYQFIENKKRIQKTINKVLRDITI